MAREEAKTDLWVLDSLRNSGVNLEYQNSSNIEIANALKGASKNLTGNGGYPDFIGVVKDFVIIVEDKANYFKDCLFEDENKSVLSLEKDAISNYAVNGAVHYAKHIINNTPYKKAIAIGVAGNKQRHKIIPVFVDDTEYYRILEPLNSFLLINENNIEEYYRDQVLKEPNIYERKTQEILKDAKELHEHLRNYGNLKDIDKPIVVSGILLALREMEYSNFSIESLIGDKQKTDGEKIFDAITDNLQRSKVSPEVKKDKMLSQFAIIKDTHVLNEINPSLNKTPLRFFTDYIYKNIYSSIKNTKSSEDYLGRFYGEFMSYSGGDGQTLGIVLTPSHITELMCELLDMKSDDVVLDPCCGTGGFLIAAMHNMFKQAKSEEELRNIRKKQLHGFEIQPYMFTIATTNMILRGDGQSNLINEDFLKQDPQKLQLKQATVGLMNPPYSQGTKENKHLYELSFTEHLLDSLVEGGRCAVIVPISSMTGKTKEEKIIKSSILKKHTLEGVITLNPNTFYGVGVHPCIAVFTAHIPHSKEKEVKFIDFKDDGYVVKKHIGLVETELAKDKKQYLIDVWFDKIQTDTKFCVKTTVEDNDEWLHSYFYFNDEIPTEEEFEKVITDYLIFEISMILQGRDYLFSSNKDGEDNVK